MGCVKTAITAKRADQQGFTLIELSIVLVIIGLIIGGILVGQDLIHGAEVRATISQIEKYNSAVNTFRNKYNGIPGDIAYTTALSFGLQTLTSGGTQGLGDGNGLIESNGADKAYFLGEPPLFWYHMSQAGYVDGGFSSSSGTNGMAALSAAGAIANATSAYQVDAYMPPARLGRSNSVTVASSNGLNYFFIGGFNNIPSTGIYSATLNTNNLTPLEAYNIDKKTDDGIASSGAIMAYNNDGSFVSSTIVTTALAPSIYCALGGVYITTSTIGSAMGLNNATAANATGCSLRLLMQ